MSTENNSSMSVTTGLLALVALSIHAVTEGLAIGLQESPSNVFFLLGAVATHKFVIAFCLGMELSSGWGETQVSLKFHTIYMTVFAGMSALGILLGLLLMDTAPGGLLIQALQAVAAGTLLYVTFCEVLPRERAKCHAGLAQFLAVLMGFSMLLVLDTFVPHEDENLPVNITMVLGNNSSM
ncbi:hypothetical protein B566_EDAN005603 [Ephemera danica]|nr:hypothetical protein B566_EDAN005603 [Ephemera danica]